MRANVTRAIATGLLLSGFVSPAAGQAPGQRDASARYVDVERGLTIDQMVALALEKAPSILAARARIGVARGELTQAGLRPNPTTAFEWRNEVGGIDNQSTVGVTWPLDVSRKGGRTNVARQQVVAAEHTATDAERQLAAAVRRQAALLLAAVRQFVIRETIRDTARQTRDLLAARAESGAGPPLERDLAEVESRRAEADVLWQRAEADAALAELKALVGVPVGVPLLLGETLEALAARGAAFEARPADPAVIARAVDARPDVRAAESQIALAAARTDLLRREARPDVSLTGSYMRMDAGFPQLGLNIGGQPVPIRGLFHNVTIGAMVTVPWRNRQQGDIAASVAAEQIARHEHDALRLVAFGEVEAARAREEQARRVWEIYAGGLRDLSAKNLDVVRESHRLGRASLLDVLAEMRRFLEVETASTDALLKIFSARLALEAAMGAIR